MFSSYFKIAWRSLWKDKFYTLLNVLGLALATAAFLLIIYFVRFEYSYEKFYKNADNIYRITLELYKGNEFVTTDSETHPPLAPLLKKDLPEVVDAVRIQQMDNVQALNYENHVYPLQNVYAADPSIFTVFNYDFIEGNANALNEPWQMVLTQTQAHRFFGDQPVMGKTLKLADHLYTITGVIKDLPLNTHLKMNMLLSFASLKAGGFPVDSWNGNNNFTYVQLKPHADLALFNAKLKKISKDKLRSNLYVAQPMIDIHLYSHKGFEPEVNGDIKTVRFLLVIALLIILVGSVNYVNLTTARSVEKMKEVGIRKALGSTRMALVKQFMTETIIVNVLALTGSLIIIRVVLPLYLQLIGRPIPGNPFSSVSFWALCIGLFLANCLLSGIYPAIILSSIKPISITRKTTTVTTKGAMFRKGLVVGQFVAALVVLSASFIVYRQLTFLKGQQLGMNTEQLLVVKRPPLEGTDAAQLERSRLFRNSLEQLPHVEKVSVTGSVPGVSLNELSTMSGLSQYGSDKGMGYNFYLYNIDGNFIPAMEMKMIAGDNFHQGSPNKDAVIISRQAAKLFGFSSPEAAIGGRISLSFAGLGYTTVVGVVEDYHQQSLKSPLIPMIHWYNEDGAFYCVKVNATDMHSTIAQVTALWKQQFPAYDMEYHFMNEMFDQQYKSDQQFGSIVTVFSGFTLFITCLGILGLTAYNITRRGKEIGIRKVLGASVAGIVTLLSKDFVKLVLIALLIATPLSWYVMNLWLQDFTYHIDIQWWIFALAGLLTMSVAMITVGYQSVKAALVNPVKSLRSE